MPRGHHLTAEQVERIRELRADGLTYEQVAAIVGCGPSSVWKYAPGRPGKVPVAPLREAFLASGKTAADVARELGWWAHTRTGPYPDTSRVRRALGLLADSNHGCRFYRTVTDAETVERIAYAIGRMPWEFLSDDEGEEVA